MSNLYINNNVNLKIYSKININGQSIKINGVSNDLNQLLFTYNKMNHYIYNNKIDDTIRSTYNLNISTLKNNIKKNILDNISSINNNEVIKIKLNETITQLSSKNVVGLVKENQLTSLLTAYELVEELKKIQNEKTA